MSDEEITQEATETGLVPVEESPLALPDEPVEEFADAEPDGDEPADLLIKCRAKLKKVDIADASNGATYKVQFEADAPLADSFVELMGEAIYEFLYDGYLFGIGEIKAVNTTADSSNYPHTVVNLLFPASEIPRSGPMNVLVGSARILKVVGVQMAFDLTKKAE